MALLVKQKPKHPGGVKSDTILGAARSVTGFRGFRLKKRPSQQQYQNLGIVDLAREII
jgi:hypothetical protein